MADDHDALLAQADRDDYSRMELLQLKHDLAAALRESQANYLAALDNLAQVMEGFDAKLILDRPYWYRDPILADDGEQYGLDVMFDRHWRVFCHAAQRATHGDTT